MFCRYLPREVDPLVYNMSHEDPGDVSYSEIGGLSEQIRELREVPSASNPIRHWAVPSLKLLRAKPPSWCLVGCSGILSDQCFLCFIESAWIGIKMKIILWRRGCKDLRPFRLWECLEVKWEEFCSKTARIALGNGIRTARMWFEHRALRGSSNCRARAGEWIDPQDLCHFLIKQFLTQKCCQSIRMQRHEQQAGRCSITWFKTEAQLVLCPFPGHWTATDKPRIIPACGNYPSQRLPAVRPPWWVSKGQQVAACCFQAGKSLPCFSFFPDL